MTDRHGSGGTGIEAKGLTVAYRGGTVALRDVTFAIPEGSITALVGVNGAGKSTLFKAIMGFVPITAGEISLLDMDIGEALRRHMVSYVPQAEEVDWEFPVLVEDVVMMGRYGHMSSWRVPSHEDRKAVDAALERADMSAHRRRQIGELSGGQKKRVFLARAMAQDGRIVLLDEPFTGVDVKTEAAITAVLRELKGEGRVMLVSTHNLGSVPEFCDRTVLLDGTVLASGPTSEVFTHANLEIAFGGALRRFVLGGKDLHRDDDSRTVTVITDDERPFVVYDENRSEGK